MQIKVLEFYTFQNWYYFRVLFSPCIPLLHSFEENVKMIWISYSAFSWRMRVHCFLFRHLQPDLVRHLRHVFVAAAGEVHRFNNSAISTATSGNASGLA